MSPESATQNPPSEALPAAAYSLAVLETKLYSPKWRPGLVSRPRLIERLLDGVEQPLTLVSAPAGFGKTTLLAEWLAKRPNCDAPVGWVSLDRSENDAALFWAYVIRALQKVQPGLGSTALSMLHSTRRPPAELVLTSLINEIAASDREFVVVLDDYHVIEAPQVHAGVTFLVDHLPARMQLIIASRSDPGVPLARLRARGQVTELRAADLRFTPDETASFLNQVMALGLTAADVSMLETRTEGWIAGLKLAALSLKNRGDVQKFVRAFSGDNRYVADYLIQEILLAQPENVRRFLLATAILERLSGPLCDAVTGGRGAQVQLERMERSNLFVIPLDDSREWYRYHHLFAEVLRTHSMRADPGQVLAQHRSASSWFETNGSLTEALHHAAAAEDWVHVARLLELNWPAMDRSYQTAKWLERVRALPDAIVRARPVLSLGFAWTLLNAGELGDVETRLRDVERWVENANYDDHEQMVVVDEKRFRSLAVEVGAARAYLAQARGEVAGTVEHARRLLDQIPEAEHGARITPTALLALAQWTRGELEDAYETFTSALGLMRAAGLALDAIRGEFVPADIRVSQGRLRDAVQIHERALTRAKESHHAAAPETDELYLGLSELHRERGDLDAAARLLHAITEMAASAVHTGNRQRWCTAMARVEEARGNAANALALLDEAERVDVIGPLPRLRPVAALRARIWISQGRLPESYGWAKHARVSVDDELSYLREFEYITLARLFVAQYRAERDERAMRDALGLLERLLMAAAQGGRKGSMIEIFVLEALVRHSASDVRGALDPLERALALAAPEEYLRVFVDEGESMRDLLRHAAGRGVGGAYTARVLAAFERPTESAPAAAPIVAEGAPDSNAEPAAEILTARELEILRLIAVGMRNQEIGAQLAISPATVKRHVANAYTKLNVSHRTEALVRARALNLL